MLRDRSFNQRLDLPVHDAFSRCTPVVVGPGVPDSWLSYPEEQAFYPVSVRHNKCLPTASFRFPVTRDTLAFGYKIPAITAPSGLRVIKPRTR